MTYLGDFNPGDVVEFKFTTVAPTTGKPAALGCTPTLVVYKDNNPTPETWGITLSASCNSVVGLNHGSIDTSGCGLFYSSGSSFQVVMATGSVCDISIVGYTVKEFSLQHRSPLRPTVAGRTLDVTAAGGASPDWGNVENAGATVTLSGTTVGALASKTGFELSTTGIDAILDRPIAEPTGVFAWASASLRGIIQWLGARASNQQTQTTTTTTVYNRAAGCTLATSTSCDSGGVTTRGSFS